MAGGKEVLHFGETLSGMPTRPRRIAVRYDPELAGALDRVRRRFPGRPAAAIVRELALEGAARLAEEEARREAAIERLIAGSPAPGGPGRTVPGRARDAWARRW
ncbi:MAG TPA: hypothetical protein VFB42_00575 [Gaiellaceae bacterium]|nr:hypothetical protein [Gaiellaceae bacterium]